MRSLCNSSYNHYYEFDENQSVNQCLNILEEKSTRNFISKEKSNATNSIFDRSGRNIESLDQTDRKVHEPLSAVPTGRRIHEEEERRLKGDDEIIRGSCRGGHLQSRG